MIEFLILVSSLSILNQFRVNMREDILDNLFETVN